MKLRLIEWLLLWAHHGLGATGVHESVATGQGVQITGDATRSRSITHPGLGMVGSLGEGKGHNMGDDAAADRWRGATQLTIVCPLTGGAPADFTGSPCCWRYLSWFMLILSRASMLCCFIFSMTTDGGRLMLSKTEKPDAFEVNELRFSCSGACASGRGRLGGPMMRLSEPVMRSLRDGVGLGGGMGRLGRSGT